MTNNVSAIMDDTYNYSMWVELYNESSSTTYNQAACYFTDNLNEPRKWNPPYKLIGPQAFSLLWFEQPEKAGHASFKLKPEGGKLYLLNASAQILDSVIYPPQYRNISYGRKTNGSSEWVFFEQFSASLPNNNKTHASQQCESPVFKLPAGFYSGSKNVAFETPAPGDTIYYSRNGDEPTRKSYRYTPGYVVTISNTSIFRARTFSPGKLPSQVVTATFFLNERNFKLPVVSIVTEQKNLTDNTIGIYVEGTNGITGNGMDRPANWNQDWWRPANFELYDTTFTARLNQELDIQIAGGWTRMNKQKSLKINPRNKYGDNLLRYDIFAATKPNMKYRSILLRNSGNDFDHSMMRDGYMQSLIMKRMDLDYIAYEPAVSFINGIYYGIQNLRERSDEDFVFSNYGYEEEDIILLESWEMNSDTEFKKLTNYVTNNDITQKSVYDNVCKMMDMESFMNYFMSEIYLRNTDWPHNNIKSWKKKDVGKWRWILYDTDFGYNLWSNDHTHNTLTWALGEHSGSDPANAQWSTILLRRLILNDTFRKNFIDKFCIHMSSTFKATRANEILDSLAGKIATEITYHKNKWGSGRTFNNDIATMKGFSANRPNSMMNFIGSRFLNNQGSLSINISANIPNAKYLFNSETIQDAQINLTYFRNQTFTLTPIEPGGFKFKHWLVTEETGTTTLLANKSPWKYFDGNAMPASNWYAKTYNDQNWKTGNAPLGYGNLGHTTTIGYGNDTQNKYPASYYRKTIQINDLASKDNFVISTFVDDGAAVYVNGTEVGRVNMPTGTLTFNTFSTTYNNGVTGTINVPKNLLTEGNNVIAAEVHQTSGNSSDVIFELQMTCSSATNQQTIENPVFSGTTGSPFSIQAVYEQSTFEDPDKDKRAYINEVVSSNNVIQDEHGDTDDYIEIYNDSDTEVNIGGWYITDTPYNPTLFQIPTNNATLTTIPAKGYLVLWADDEPEQGILHLNFKLSKDGEQILLSKYNYLDNLIVVDSISIVPLEQNLSYSRVPDGSSSWMIKSMTCNYNNSFGADVQTVAEHNIRVYPTMLNNMLTIENARGQTVTIYDLSGQRIMSTICESDKEMIEVGYLRKGAYILSAGSIRIKIIKL